ncbi:MAG: hypothetical protein WD176_00955 [Pirellulales bacterium]
MHDVQTNSGQHEPCTAGVPERVKVEHLASVILDGQEVALLASH